MWTMTDKSKKLRKGAKVGNIDDLARKNPVAALAFAPSLISVPALAEIAMKHRMAQPEICQYLASLPTHKRAKILRKLTVIYDTQRSFTG